MKKPKKRTLRGYQTALGIAFRRENRLRKDLVRQEHRAEDAESRLFDANETIRNLRDIVRGVIGEVSSSIGDVKYRRAVLALNLDNREYGPIPPMHIHVTPKGYGYGLCGHTQAYICELNIPEDATLNYKTAHVIHKSLHELVDYLERHNQPRPAALTSLDAPTKGIVA